MADRLDLPPMQRIERPSGARVFVGQPVRVGHRRRVIGAFHPPFDFEGVHARVRQIAEVFDHAQVAGGKQVAAAFVLLGAQNVLRPLLLGDAVFPAAGLGAAPLVRAAACIIGGQQAAARVGDAHRAVDEDLQLQLGRRVSADEVDFLQRQLARQHNPPKALPIPEAAGGRVDDRRLRGQMQHRLRVNAADDLRHARVRHDEGVRPCVAQRGDAGREQRQLAVARHRVERDVQLRAAPVRVVRALRERFGREVAGGGAHPEALGRTVDRVRPVIHGKAQLLKVSGGREQLDPFRHDASLSSPASSSAFSRSTRFLLASCSALVTA